jgi:hypothetical protein
MSLFVFPYRELKGESVIGGWFSIEAVFAYGCVLIFLVCTYLLIYGARRSYVRRLKQ